MECRRYSATCGGRNCASAGRQRENPSRLSFWKQEGDDAHTFTALVMRIKMVVACEVDETDPKDRSAVSHQERGLYENSQKTGDESHPKLIQAGPRGDGAATKTGLVGRWPAIWRDRSD